MMKILIINTVRFNRNGISQFIMNIYDELSKVEDYQLSIVANECFDVSYLNDIVDKDLLYVLPSRKKQLFKYIRELYKLSELNFDIIHIHGNSQTMYLETLIFRKYKNRIIVHAHNVTNSHPFVYKILNRRFKASFKLALACSQKAGLFLFENNFDIVRNSIDINKFIFSDTDRIELRKMYNLDQKIICLNVGRFNKQKNQEFILKIAKYIDSDKIHYVFVGDGDLLNYHKIMAKELKLEDKVTFIGNTAEVEKFYSMADIFLLPSHYESFGLTLVEAQINGLHIICNDNLPDDAIFTNLVTKLPLDIKTWTTFINNSNERQLTSNNVIKATSLYGKSEIANMIIKYYNSIGEEAN